MSFRSVAVQLVKARNSNRRPSRSRGLKKSKAPALIQVTDRSLGLSEEMKCRKILSCAGSPTPMRFFILFSVNLVLFLWVSAGMLPRVLTPMSPDVHGFENV